jgi:aerobic-type carbon monoxide dehydrogenase small subunit (CoxS/CutS family)
MDMAPYKLNINGKSYEVDVASDMPLLWVLRDVLQLTGTKFGCGVASCGACTVLLDGVATRSCVLPVESVAGAAVTTIEGLSSDGSHPIQKAWEAVGVPQCGYCQSGQMMTLAGLLTQQPNPSAEALSAAMSQVLCRCGTYQRIKQAAEMAIASTQK